MAEKKKQEPYIYGGELKELGAKIVVEYYPDSKCIYMELIKNKKEYTFVMTDFDINKSLVTTMDYKTKRIDFYNVIHNDDLPPCEFSIKEEAGEQA